MTTTHQEPQPASGAASWLARTPSWVGDLLAIALVLVTSFLGGPMGLGGKPGNKPGGHGGPAPGSGPTPPGGAEAGGSGGPRGASGLVDLSELGGPILALAVPVALVLLACALIVLRRRWPLTVLGLSLALYLASVLLGEPSMGIGIVVILAAFSVGARTSRRTALIAGGSATLLLTLLSLTSSQFGVIDVRVFQVAAGIAVAVALGDSSRSHRELVAAATERAERAEQSREAEAQQRVAHERLRIAQDLHDTVAHQISVISLNAGVASRVLDSNPEKARGSLHTIRTSSREVLSEIGDLLTYLRADGESAAAAPQPGAGDLATLVSRVREAGLEVTLTTAGDLDRVAGAAGRVLYRVVQEGLTNAHKHGSGGRASVDIAVDDESVIVSISNPVDAAAPNHPESLQGGLGLTGIRERVAAIGGTVATSVGAHFTIEARLPRKREEQA